MLGFNGFRATIRNIGEKISILPEAIRPSAPVSRTLCTLHAPCTEGRGRGGEGVRGGSEGEKEGEREGRKLVSDI